MAILEDIFARPELPVLSLGVFIRPAVVVFAVTVIAGAYPAWRAARVDPSRVLRGAE